MSYDTASSNYLVRLVVTRLVGRPAIDELCAKHDYRMLPVRVYRTFLFLVTYGYSRGSRNAH